MTLVTRTLPKLLVKGRVSKLPCPWPKGIERIAIRSVTLGASYEAAVNRQRVKEAPDDEVAEYFEAGKLWNGAGVHDTAYTVKHKDTGRIYFAVKPAQKASDNQAGSAAVVREDQWRDVATGKVLDFEADGLAEFLPAQSKSQVQEVDQDVQWRTIALDSILELRYGDVYQVVRAAA